VCFCVFSCYRLCWWIKIIISGFAACCQRCDHHVLYTHLCRTVASWWHSSLAAAASFVVRERRTTNYFYNMKPRRYTEDNSTAFNCHAVYFVTDDFSARIQMIHVWQKPSVATPVLYFLSGHVKVECVKRFLFRNHTSFDIKSLLCGE